jgi:IS30 family transposase
MVLTKMDNATAKAVVNSFSVVLNRQPGAMHKTMTYDQGREMNGRISEIVNQTRFGSAAELESTLRNYLKIYNNNIPQRALGHQTPIQALKLWHEKKPELFTKRVYNQAGLDRYPASTDRQQVEKI